MFDDEAVKKAKGHEVGMVIDTMSVEELSDRIEMLRQEIARLEAMENRQNYGKLILLTAFGAAELDNSIENL